MARLPAPGPARSGLHFVALAASWAAGPLEMSLNWPAAGSTPGPLDSWTLLLRTHLSTLSCLEWLQHAEANLEVGSALLQRGIGKRQAFGSVILVQTVC